MLPPRPPAWARSEVVHDARELRGASRGEKAHHVPDLLRFHHIPHQLLMAVLVAEPGLRLGLHERDDAVGARRRRMHGQHAHACSREPLPMARVKLASPAFAAAPHTYSNDGCSAAIPITL